MVNKTSTPYGGPFIGIRAPYALAMVEMDLCALHALYAAALLAIYSLHIDVVGRCMHCMHETIDFLDWIKL